MEKEFVDVVFILDMSGSMEPLADDVIGGYNSLLEELKADEEVLISTVVFNNESKLIHNRVPACEVTKLTKKSYKPSGCTALLDAVGETLDRLEEEYDTKPARKTLIYITTDGHENSSWSYSYKMINKMIKWHTKKDKWEITFLAANIDVEEECERLGIAKECAESFAPTSKGVKYAYDICLSNIKSNKKR